MALALTVACSKDVIREELPQEVSSKPLRVLSMTGSPAPLAASTGQGPVLVFWYATDFPSFGDAVQPFFTAFPDDIDSYRTVPYNTGRTYPGERWLRATGYSPADLEVSKNADGTKNWKTLNVPQDQQGYTDVMAVVKARSGNSTYPFDRIPAAYAYDTSYDMMSVPSDKYDPMLVFGHLQSKVNFKARLGDIVTPGRYFRNVRVEVSSIKKNGEGLFMAAARWVPVTEATGEYTADAATLLSRYKAGERTTYLKKWSASDSNKAQLDPKQQDSREIGSVYIYPGETQIVFDVEVEMSDDELFKNPKTIRYSGAVADFGLTLQENEEYDVLIKINYDSILLEGRKAEWEEGGILYIPVYPNEL